MNGWKGTLFKHTKDDGSIWYTIAISGKDADGEKVYEYLPIEFPQGTDIQDRAKIELTDFFMSFYTRKNGERQYKFVVKGYNFQNGYQQRQGGYQQGYQQRPQRPRQTFEQIDQDVPF